jgi:2-oxoglutarate dehydrogenase E2 component (dihydrolipoamide succinyltransferase)
MAKQIKIPTVGESITEVTIAAWLKQDGDYVEMDEAIAEVETDKATVELNADSAGTLKILVAEGETIEIGTAVAEVTEGGAPKDATPAAKSEPAPAATNGGEPKPTGKNVDIEIPTVGESITEVTVVSFMKQNGDFVEVDEAIAEVETDKATVELNAEVGGILTWKINEGDTVNVGAVVASIAEATGGAPKAAAAPAQTSAPSAAPASTSGDKNYPSPAAKKILDEKGIDASFTGTGKDGRITKADAMAAQAKPAASKSTSTSTPAAAAPSMSGDRAVERKKMTGLRKTIAKRLVAAKNTTAMLTTFNEVDMKPIMDLRKRYKEAFKEKHGVGLGFMSLFTKACCLALKQVPAINAQIDGEETLHFNYADVGIAVSTPKGLMVPVVRDADKLSLAQIESEIIRLATKARDGKISVDDMSGGTFTITNGGVFGSMLSTPILNAPQSAILGMHNIVQRPWVVDGKVEVRPIMYLALSYDHRIVDGRESVTFLKTVKELIEDPARMLLDL